VHKIFESKKPHRVNDIIKHLEDMGLIFEEGKELPRGKTIRIIDIQRVKKILIIFPHDSTR